MELVGDPVPNRTYSFCMHISYLGLEVEWLWDLIWTTLQHAEEKEVNMCVVLEKYTCFLFIVENIENFSNSAHKIKHMTNHNTHTNEKK